MDALMALVTQMLPEMRPNVKPRIVVNMANAPPDETGRVSGESMRVD